MTPLERAARALAAEDFKLHSPQVYSDTVRTPEQFADLGWRQYLESARAVLQAIREPSIAMGKAYYDEDWGVEQLPSLSEVWATLIDAALEEG